MASKKNDEPTPHSKFHGLLLTVAVILGIPGVIGIYVWISSHVEGSVRIPVILLIFPVLLFVAIAGVIDDNILKKSPHLVREKDRYLLATRLGHDPVTGAPLAAGGYGSVQGYGAVGGYGSVDGAAQTAYGSQPQYQAVPQASQYGYGQAPTARAPRGYGQTAS